MAEELSLGDMVRQLALLMKENDVLIAFKNEEPWHVLFYRLKKEAATERPPFLDRLRFDSGGHYPRCRELSEFLHGLHTACTVDVANPSYEEMIIPQDVMVDWQEERGRLTGMARNFLAHGLEVAKAEFPLKHREHA